MDRNSDTTAFSPTPFSPFSSSNSFGSEGGTSDGERVSLSDDVDETHYMRQNLRILGSFQLYLKLYVRSFIRVPNRLSFLEPRHRRRRCSFLLQMVIERRIFIQYGPSPALHLTLTPITMAITLRE